MENLELYNKDFWENAPLFQVGDRNLDWDEVPELRDYFNSFQKQVPAELQSRLEAEYFGLGPLVELVDDEAINEIVINGPKDIFYEKNMSWHQHQEYFLTNLTYYQFIQRLCHESGSNLSKKHPFLCTKWRDFRVHISEASISGQHSMSLRRHPKEHWSFRKLLDLDWCGDYDLELLQDAIEQKQNILVIGATGSGKTSLMNALLDYISFEDRCVILEDTDELFCPNPLSIKLLTRQEEQENKLDPVNLEELVKQSLRMRPDRLVLGEVRGSEAKDLLMALATGHKGSIASLHADSAQEALLRLEMLIQLGAPNWSIEAIRRLIYLSIDKIVVVKKKKGIRKLDSLWKIHSLEKFGLTLHQEN